MDENSQKRLKKMILEKILGERLGHLFKSSNLSFEHVDQEIKNILESLAIKIQEAGSPPLYAQVKEYFGISIKELRDMPFIKERMDGETDIVFDIWCSSNQNLKVVHRGNYHEVGATHAIFHMKGGRSVPTSFAVLAFYYGKPCFFFFDYIEKFQQWVVSIQAEKAEELAKTLMENVDDYILQSYKGKELDFNFKPALLKKSPRHQLIYSKAMASKVDDLCITFENWLKSPYVHQWCCFLTGPVGCGKTTVGGLLANFKEDFTVLYCHSSEISDASFEIPRMFKNAQKLSPTLLIIDDLHMLFKTHEHLASEYTSLLMECLEGLQEKKSKIFILLTASESQFFDSALLYRPGRFSKKIAFGDYSECLPALLTLYSEQLHLNLSQGTISSALNQLPEGQRVLSPDEAKNVCQNLHLLYGELAISSETLAHTILQVYEDYHAHADVPSACEGVRISEKEQEF